MERLQPTGWGNPSPVFLTRARVITAIRRWLDERGFVLTGRELNGSVLDDDAWRERSREPFLLETSLPGVFAAGDVRSGSIKRVAFAVGEGAMAVRLVHQHLAAAGVHRA